MSVALLCYCGLAPRGGFVGVDFGVQFILDEFEFFGTRIRVGALPRVPGVADGCGFFCFWDLGWFGVSGADGR